MSASDLLSFFFDVSVSVVNGAGNTEFWNVVDAPPVGFAGGLTARLLNVSVKVPSDTPTYDWIISDEAGFAIAGLPAVSGNVVVSIPGTVPIYPRAVLSVASATLDGTYSFRVYCEQSH